jgi:hypothetical protein
MAPSRQVAGSTGVDQTAFVPLGFVVDVHSPHSGGSVPTFRKITCMALAAFAAFCMSLSVALHDAAAPAKPTVVVAH